MGRRVFGVGVVWVRRRRRRVWPGGFRLFGPQAKRHTLRAPAPHTPPGVRPFRCSAPLAKRGGETYVRVFGVIFGIFDRVSVFSTFETFRDSAALEPASNKAKWGYPMSGFPFRLFRFPFSPVHRFPVIPPPNTLQLPFLLVLYVDISIRYSYTRAARSPPPEFP